MSNENPTSTRVSAGALYDNTSAAGEYLFSVMMVMLAALGKALARLFAAIDRRLGWLGGKILSGLKILGEKIASPFRRYGMALRMGVRRHTPRPCRRDRTGVHSWFPHGRPHSVRKARTCSHAVQLGASDN